MPSPPPPLPRLMVAPNGARLGRDDHPALPLRLPEIVATARACMAAGADGLHLHLRDADGGHLLDAGAYGEALAELERAAPGLAVQITTEAAGRYGPAHQRQVALESGAALVSAAVREVLADDPAEARAFLDACAERGIALQHILYDAADLARLKAVLGPEGLAAPGLQLLFVLGGHGPGQGGAPHMLAPFLDALKAEGMAPDWALCAFGRRETECLLAGHAAGGKLRVGFENSLFNADGRIAADNAERVRDLRAALARWRGGAGDGAGGPGLAGAA